MDGWSWIWIVNDSVGNSWNQN